MTFDKHDIEQLYAPFPLSAHSIREGYKTNNRIRWFVYLSRSAIQRRLDELFPGEWEFIPGERTQSEAYISYSATLIIRGVQRGFNGGQAQDTRWEDGKPVAVFNENVEKGAMTDTFRRTASLWGLGDYLNDSIEIYTPAYDKKDWKARQDAENAAKKAFVDWYRATYQTDDASEVKVETVEENEPEPTPRPADAWNMTELDKAVTFLMPNVFERGASLKKHAPGGEEPVWKTDDKLSTAISRLVLYKTMQRLNLDYADADAQKTAIQFMRDALDSSYSEFIQAGNSHEEAWHVICDALELRARDNGAPEIETDVAF